VSLTKTKERVMANRMKGLTDRERQVLLLIAQGFTDAEIGRELCISVFTVQNHVKSILRKLEARNRAQACMIYVREI
jgi:DNA-binding NarL/FixJ family response regulator